MPGVRAKRTGRMSTDYRSRGPVSDDPHLMPSSATASSTLLPSTEARQVELTTGTTANSPTPTVSSAAEPPDQSPSKEERQAGLATGTTTSPPPTNFRDHGEGGALDDLSIESSAAEPHCD